MLVKKFLLAFVLVHSSIVVVIFGVSLAILVMVPVEAVLLGEPECIMHYALTLAPLLALGLDSWRKHILEL